MGVDGEADGDDNGGEHDDDSDGPLMVRPDL